MTRKKYRKWGTYMETRITVRVSKIPITTQTLTVTERSPGYFEFRALAKSRLRECEAVPPTMVIEPASDAINTTITGKDLALIFFAPILVGFAFFVILKLLAR